MNNKAIRITVLSAAVACAMAGGTAARSAPSSPGQQSVGSKPQEAQANPLNEITKAFPDSINLKEEQRLLEFCPDKDTCDGFVATRAVPVSTLKDFAYLYIYFFSGYYALPEWRTRQDARNIAEAILSKPIYSKCRGGASIESARCILLDLNRGGRISLLFVRYDEGKRNVVHEDIVKELSAGEAEPK